MISSIPKYISDVFYSQLSKKDIDEEYKEPLPEMSTKEKKPSEITYNAISHYLDEKIGSDLDSLFTPKINYSATSILNPIENLSMSSVGFQELGYNKNILFRYKYSNNNFFDIFSIYGISENKKTEILDNLSKTMTIDSESIQNILENGSLYTNFNKELVPVVVQLLDELAKEIYNKLDINIMFIYRSISINIPKNFIVYSNDIEKPLYVIYINTPINKQVIYFEPMLHINLERNTASLAVSDNGYANYLLSKTKAVVQKKQSPRPSSPKQKKAEQYTEVVFEPLDKEEELPIVEVDLGKEKRTFLMGRTGNLYEDDDKSNGLVGKIIYNSTGKSTIYWCKDYLL